MQFYCNQKKVVEIRLKMGLITSSVVFCLCLFTMNGINTNKMTEAEPQIKLQDAGRILWKHNKHP